MGEVTAGHQSAKAKDNLQLPEGHPVGRELGEMIVQALQRNPLFIAAALPLHVFPPLFNSYSGGQSFGSHVDNSIRQVPGTAHRIRTDLSCTLFLTGPEDYDGGELMVEDTYGVHSVKLPAGHLVLYPSTSLHHVRPVTRGARVCSFFWLQSMVRQRRRPDAAVRSRRRHPQAAADGRGAGGGGAAHRRVPQPAAPLGRVVTGSDPIQARTRLLPGIGPRVVATEVWPGPEWGQTPSAASNGRSGGSSCRRDRRPARRPRHRARARR